MFMGRVRSGAVATAQLFYIGQFCEVVILDSLTRSQHKKVHIKKERKKERKVSHFITKG